MSNASKDAQILENDLICHFPLRIVGKHTLPLFTARDHCTSRIATLLSELLRLRSLITLTQH